MVNAHQEEESTDCCNNNSTISVNLSLALSSLLISDGRIDPEVSRKRNNVIGYRIYFFIYFKYKNLKCKANMILCPYVKVYYMRIVKTNSMSDANNWYH